MYNYKIPTDITNKVAAINSAESKKKKYEDLFSKLDNINSKFDTNSNISIPDKITLDRMEFNKPTDEEIKKQSEEGLLDFKNTGNKKIDDEYKLKQDELNSKKSDSINATDEAKEKLSGYYKEAKNEAEGQALKRGLARSSIVLNQLDAFNNSEIEDYKTLDNKLSKEINALNFELNALNTQKDSALKDFDIAYAVKLQDKINSINSELSKKETEVTKYNNDIAIKEAEYNKSLQELQSKLENENWDKNTDLIELYGKYGSNIIEKAKQDEVYRIAKQYLGKLSEQERIEILNDDAFKSKLGASYEKLLKDFS